MRDLAYLLSVWLHILAAIFWLGGMLFLSLVVVPELRGLPDAARRAEVLAGVAQRFRTLGWAAIALLVATGVVNASLRWSTANLSKAAFWGSAPGRVLGLKLALVAVMIGLSLVHDAFLGPRLAEARDTRPGLRRRTVWLARGNAALGLVVVLVAALLARMDGAALR